VLMKAKILQIRMVGLAAGCLTGPAQVHKRTQMAARKAAICRSAVSSEFEEA